LLNHGNLFPGKKKKPNFVDFRGAGAMGQVSGGEKH